MQGEQQCFWLMGSDREIPLGEYPTIVGRDITCDLVINGDPLVSRRHACFSIQAGRPSVEDLGSRNGVYVDGVRIETPYALQGAETVQVGGLQLRLKVQSAAETRGAPASARPRKASSTAETLSRDDETGAASVFHLLGGVAEKALKLGNHAEAERVLTPALNLVLAEAQRLQRLDEQSQLHALNYACRLAEATRRGEWLEYVFRLQIALKRPPPAGIVEELHRLVRRVRIHDLESLRSLTALLLARREQFGASEKFLVSRIEGLVRVAES